jgi:hypothetical protein
MMRCFWIASRARECRRRRMRMRSIQQAMTVLHDAFLGARPVEEVCREFTAQVNEILSSEVCVILRGTGL